MAILSFYQMLESIFIAFSDSHNSLISIDNRRIVTLFLDLISLKTRFSIRVIENGN